GKKYDVLSTSFSFNRSVDPKGRPSSGVYGGEIHLVVESYADTTLLEIMLNKQHTAQTGDVTYDQGSSDGVMKTLKFVDAFITNYTESAAAHSSDAMTIQMTLSAREISMGDAAKHVNLWPDNKA
ncbi:MAG: type VI secretion system needle protein Hcp, partial [Bacteroidetes bacterium]|nr:type VI secretion system needle protein Hcp [Bacteroidota bacterium]